MLLLVSNFENYKTQKMKNRSYLIGQLLFILALGLMLFKDNFDG